MTYAKSFYDQNSYSMADKTLNNSEILFHKDFYYEVEKVQQLYEALHLDFKSILIIGEPGIGKTHLARYLVPDLLKKIHGKEVQVRTTYNNLGDFENNMGDFKIVPWIENNSAVWKKTPLVVVNEEANKKNNLIVNNIFDEISRLRNEAQNFLLPVLEDNEHRGFLLPQLGEMVRIKKESVNICLANPSGQGTNALNEALLSRVAIIRNDYPAPEVMALSMEGTQNVDEKTYACLDDLASLEERTFDDESKVEIIDCFNKILKLSFRDVKEIIFWLSRSPFPRIRLLEYISVRQRLGIIDVDEEPLLEWISYDLDDLLENLGIMSGGYKAAF